MSKQCVVCKVKLGFFKKKISKEKMMNSCNFFSYEVDILDVELSKLSSRACTRYVRAKETDSFLHEYQRESNQNFVICIDCWARHLLDSHIIGLVNYNLARMKQNDYKIWIDSVADLKLRPHWLETNQKLLDEQDDKTTIFQLYKWKKDEILGIKESCNWCKRQSRIADVSDFYDFLECKECNKKRQENEKRIAKQIERLSGQAERAKNSYFNLERRTTGVTPRGRPRMNAGSVHLPRYKNKWKFREEKLRTLRLDHARKYFFNENSGYCGWCEQHFSWKADEPKKLGDFGSGSVSKKRRLICKKCYEKQFSSDDLFRTTEEFFKLGL